MTTAQKIRIDKYIGTPVVVFLNLLARLLGKTLRINHNLTSNTSYICITKFVGIGSIIQTTPLIQTLKLNYPESRIIFLTSIKNKRLIEMIAVVDEALYIDERNFFTTLFSSADVVLKLWKKRKGCFIDLEIYSNFSTIISTLSCATNRIGYYRKDSGIRMGIYTHMISFSIIAPIAQVYLQMARLLNCKEIINELYHFNLDKQQSLVFSNSFLKSELPYLIINPNASDLRIERRWSKENFIDVIAELLIKFPLHLFVLIGSSNESRYVQEIKNNIKSNRLIDTSGKLNLADLFQLINASVLMITNDTGPMHISFALKVKTIGLFGPCSPQQYGNFANSWSVYKSVYCSPCVHEFLLPPCGGDNQCMKQINTAEVINLTTQIINESKTDEGKALSIIYAHTENDLPLGLIRRQV